MTAKVDITVFIIVTNNRRTDFSKSAEVCSQFASGIVKADSLKHAVDMMGSVIVPHTWNLILYDDEIPEPAFVSNIWDVLHQNPNDALEVHKRGKGLIPSKSVRLFRAGIACRPDCTVPVSENATIGHYMQGFILGIANYD